MISIASVLQDKFLQTGLNTSLVDVLDTSCDTIEYSQVLVYLIVPSGAGPCLNTGLRGCCSIARVGDGEVANTSPRKALQTSLSPSFIDVFLDPYLPMRAAFRNSTSPTLSICITGITITSLSRLGTCSNYKVCKLDLLDTRST